MYVRLILLIRTITVQPFWSLFVRATKCMFLFFSCIIYVTTKMFNNGLDTGVAVCHTVTTREQRFTDCSTLHGFHSIERLCHMSEGL